jgi:hypothetical protein
MEGWKEDERERGIAGKRKREEDRKRSCQHGRE